MKGKGRKNKQTLKPWFRGYHMTDGQSVEQREERETKVRKREHWGNMSHFPLPIILFSKTDIVYEYIRKAAL